MTKVHKNRIRKWVAALRSGEFKQGRGWLRSDDRYCCLGVGCEVFRIATRQGKWVEDKGGVDDFVPNCDMQDCTEFPRSVADWFGLADRDLSLTIKGERKCASEHNDSGRRFKTIANAIEKEYLSA